MYKLPAENNTKVGNYSFSSTSKYNRPLKDNEDSIKLNILALPRKVSYKLQYYYRCELSFRCLVDLVQEQPLMFLDFLSFFEMNEKKKKKMIN
jgi:hypothetical protein